VNDEVIFKGQEVSLNFLYLITLISNWARVSCLQRFTLTRDLVHFLVLILDLDLVLDLKIISPETRRSMRCSAHRFHARIARHTMD